MSLLAEIYTRGSDGILCACMAVRLVSAHASEVIGFRCICGVIPIQFRDGAFHAESEKCECGREVLVNFGPGVTPVVFHFPRAKQSPAKPLGVRKPKARKVSSDADFLKECGITLD